VSVGARPTLERQHRANFVVIVVDHGTSPSPENLAPPGRPQGQNRFGAPSDRISVAWSAEAFDSHH